jgi:hypothetical protein
VDERVDDRSVRGMDSDELCGRTDGSGLKERLELEAGGWEGGVMYPLVSWLERIHALQTAAGVKVKVKLRFNRIEESNAVAVREVRKILNRKQRTHRDRSVKQRATATRGVSH